MTSMTIPGAGTHEVVHQVTRNAADAVDAESRLPREALDALHAAGALTRVVSSPDVGTAVRVADLVDHARELAASCGSTGMIWAMQQVAVACVARHAHPAVAKAVVDDVLRAGSLVATASSEVGVGGDMRTSLCAVDQDAGEVLLTKSASTVSFGEHASWFLLTARSGHKAPGHDQVMVVAHVSQVDRAVTRPWQAMGMRGTCSPAMDLSLRVPTDHVLADPFREVFDVTMFPLATLLQASVWLGIAEEAFRRVLRGQRSRLGKKQTLASTAVATIGWRLDALRAHVAALASDVQEHWEEERPVRPVTQMSLNALKLNAAESATECCLTALRAAGMAGYSEGGPLSVARLVRDGLAAPLMVSNARVEAANAVLLAGYAESGRAR